MALSPSSSPCSSNHSSVSPSKPSHLAVMACRGKIIEKIMENRVTLIVGETGCGKSSQVPQFVLEENMEPILCTQPRRFAVIAVARMVANARNCEVGSEVGYHVGHSKVASERSKIVFKTAGVLLDEMRDKGLKALDYKVIILDEVHERSVESDLVLVCVKQFLLKNNNLRVVLMSATADIGRYRDYFNDLGRWHRVEVIAIPGSDQRTIYQRRVSYLEEVSELLEKSSESLSQRYCSGPSPSLADADFKPEVHELIHDLVMHIHHHEKDIEKSILVFLPTYHALEQQWFLLRPFSSSFKVNILHSSIDTEEALMAMKIWKSHRKVILATNIAESSVTIPKVAYVIDSCRSLQIYWDSNRKKDFPELVWVSKSQAEQRRGRTGRTCDGQVYRLATRSFYSQLQDFECPAIQKLSLRLQVLLICSAGSKAINDPRVLLQKALDPPTSEVVEDALSLLVHMRALDRASVRGRYEPTFFGRMIASFSLSFDASILILMFGNIGMLREGILLGILTDTQPFPVRQPFGQEHLIIEYVGHYFGGDDADISLVGKKERMCMANLSAIQFWQHVFKDKHRLEHLKQLLKFGDTEIVDDKVSKIEEEWCLAHYLLSSSLHHISDTYEDILKSVHRFRPRFISKYEGLPAYHGPYEFEHACLLNNQSSGNINAFASDDEKPEAASEIVKCVAVPFVAPGHLKNNGVAGNFKEVIKEIKFQYAADSSENQHFSTGDNGFPIIDEPVVCKFFARGFCSRGDQCRYSHSLQAKRVACKFFTSIEGCRYGDSCIFSHERGLSPLFSQSSLCLQEDGEADVTCLLRLLPSCGKILILDDTVLHFSSSLSFHCNPCQIISTTSLPDLTGIQDPRSSGMRVIRQFECPGDVIISKEGEDVIPWNEVNCVLWFPNIEGSEKVEGRSDLMKKLFAYVAIRMLAEALYEVQVIVTMNSLTFSELQVERAGRESFFFLGESFPFDESELGELSDRVQTRKPMVVSRATSYVFDFCPPTGIRYSGRVSEIRKFLCR